MEKVESAIEVFREEARSVNSWGEEEEAGLWQDVSVTRI